eukprot:Pompholyxophrys_punicea_v1_NODE_127_length_3306_cov_27.855737.p3 type:complete len:130 gc:universal NODE_127_length_3306_cov_27.855737:2571-2960(+)
MVVAEVAVIRVGSLISCWNPFVANAVKKGDVVLSSCISILKSPQIIVGTWASFVHSVSRLLLNIVCVHDGGLYTTPIMVWGELGMLILAQSDSVPLIDRSCSIVKLRVLWTYIATPPPRASLRVSTASL